MTKTTTTTRSGGDLRDLKKSKGLHLTGEAASRARPAPELTQRRGGGFPGGVRLEAELPRRDDHDGGTDWAAGRLAVGALTTTGSSRLNLSTEVNVDYVGV